MFNSESAKCWTGRKLVILLLHVFVLLVPNSALQIGNSAQSPLKLNSYIRPSSLELQESTKWLQLSTFSPCSLLPVSSFSSKRSKPKLLFVMVYQAYFLMFCRYWSWSCTSEQHENDCCNGIYVSPETCLIDKQTTWVHWVQPCTFLTMLCDGCESLQKGRDNFYPMWS